MDAGQSKTQTQAEPQRMMGGGNTPQASATAGNRATFNTRNVTREDNLPCKLTVYIDYGHSFVRLENKKRGVDLARGLYPTSFVVPETSLHDKVGKYPTFSSKTLPGNTFLPKPSKPDLMDEVLRPRVDHNQRHDNELDFNAAMSSTVAQPLMLAGSVPEGGAVSAIGVGKYFYGAFSSRTLGQLPDETFTYAHKSIDIDDIPKVTFFISQQEALEVEMYISKYADACNQGNASCFYRALGFNCVDFAQEAFSKTDYPGHFIEYFTPSLLRRSVGRAALYAVSCHPVVKNTASISGTLMLAAVVGKYTVPKLAEAARGVGSWMCGWVWPEQQAVAATKVDVIELKWLHSRLQSANLSCDAFWESYEASDAQAKKLISDSVDLQTRFDYVEELIKTEGYDGWHQSFINKELKNIRDGFTEFFREANNMKSTKNSH
ncbi:hypothetical protein [Endozoicomonas sp. 8E]|uniref:hypothetical protein n=1 Tax=Endozoicomonas sp. 8E TaxID=3035692 RepID=UPI002938F44A|nr:hypothetical protein [Endozoicomonas sp. 8E]WOG29402.1 hypothetical protein P6910_07070 [Endozoicomonas sp. 8E]